MVKERNEALYASYRNISVILISGAGKLHVAVLVDLVNERTNSLIKAYN